jgi:hypothetical protein
MATKRIGEPVPSIPVEEIVADHDDMPGLGWKVSEETQREIEEIEENIRLAEQRIGSLVIR